MNPNFKLPFTQLQVIKPEGGMVTMTGDATERSVYFMGLQFGDLKLQGSEIFAVRQLLNTMFQDTP